MKKIKVFFTTPSTDFVKNLDLNTNYELSNFIIKRFSDREIYVKINENIAGCECLLIGSTCNSENLVELLILIDSLKNSNAEKIKVFIPYFGYSRQDKKNFAGESISAKFIAKLIETSGATEIILFDIHAPQILGFFNIPTFNIESSEIFYDFLIKKYNFNSQEFILLAPDCGSINRTRKLSKLLNCNIAVIDKYRPQANISEVMNIIGEVKDKNVFIYDDIIDTAGTICTAAKTLKENGAKEIYVLASHAVLSGNAIKNIEESLIEKFIFLNTVPIPDEKMLKNFEIINISFDYFLKKQ